MRFMVKKGPGGYEVHLNYNFVGKKENITRKQSYYNTVLRNKNFKTFNQQLYKNATRDQKVDYTYGELK